MQAKQQTTDSFRRTRREARLRAGRLLVLCLLFLFAWGGGAALAAPAVGTVITNTATVSYDIPGTGQSIANASSNTVTAVVSQIAAFTLTSSQTRTVPANTPVVFSHTLTNTGNGSDRFVLTIQNPAPGCAGCGYTFSSAGLAPDTSPQDGVPDSASQATITTPLLAAGQSYTFVLTAQVPAGIVAGQFAQAQITAIGDAATAAGGGFTAATSQTNTDQATVGVGALISTTKSFSTISGPSPGSSNILVTITYTNNSAVAASNVRIQDWIGVSNPAGGPALNTTGLRYVAGSARWSGCNSGNGVMTDAVDGFEAACAAVSPQRINYRFTANATAGTGVVDALIETVPANASGQITFSLQVTGGLSAGSAQTNNAARISYCDSGTCGGSTNQTSDTNQALYTVNSVSGVDLTLTKTVSSPASGKFSISNAGEYLIQVNNVGPNPSVGTITMTDTLPGGLDVTGITAPAWSCSQSGAYTSGNNTGGGVSITCTTTSIVAAASGTAGQAPAIRIAVVPRIVAGVLTIPAAGFVTLTNTASVTGGGEIAANTGNNSGSVSTQVSMGASVQGRVWRDIPTSVGVLPNRLYDAGIDQPLGGWKVEVLDPNTQQVIKSVLTNGSGSGADFGKYNITDLVPGTYLLQFRDPKNSIVSGTAVCAATAAAADPMGSPNGSNPTGSFNSSNCEIPTGGASAGTRSQLDQSGRYLRITLQGGETIIDQNLPLDPSGIVYDARTGAAVSDAIVKLVALTTARTPLAGFSAATDLVGGTGADTWVTGSDGFYQFLLTFAGQTRCQLAGGCILELSVTPPSGYQPFSVSSALYPPTASTGNCTAFATNCLDATGGLGFLDASGAVITVPPIPTTSKYYLRFLVDNNSRQIINNHFPLVTTSQAVNNLLVQKKANRTDAEVGDFADYTVTVLNGTSINASPVTVTDRLPAGFKYVAGTTRLMAGSGTGTGLPAADPAGGAGPVLNFNVGSLAAGASLTLTYRVQLSINAPQGDGKNLASAAAPGLGSNVATAIVKVRGGVFDTKGYIVGTVFMDCNRDRVQGPREPGIPGVRLFMEDGTMVVTDAEGKYSLYGISPRTHVMKVDEITLPRGAELIALNNRNAGDPSSRFVDVKVGEMARADFAEGSCAPEVFAEVKARRAKGETGQAELNRAFGSGFAGTVTPLAPVAQGAPSSGVVTGPVVTAPSLGASLTPLTNAPLAGSAAAGGLPGIALPPGYASSGGALVLAPGVPVQPGAPVLPGVPHVTAPAYLSSSGGAALPDANRDPGVQGAAAQIFNPVNAAGAAGSINASNSNLPPKTGDLTSAQLPDVATAPIVAEKLEDLLPGFDSSFAVLNLKDGDTLPIAQANIRLKGAFGTRFVLTVNGDEVPMSRVGQKSTLEAKGIQAWEYIGVALKKGANEVIARQLDQFGNARGEIKLNLIAPGELGKLLIESPDSATADGTTPVLVKVRLTDEAGVPVTARTAVTLTTTLGRWDAQDLNPSEPGTQVFITGGAATFKLTPSADPGDATVSVVGGNFKAQKKVAFLPYMRPLTGAGIIEGAFSLNSLSLKNMVAAQQRDGFEQQIQRFHYESGDGKRATEGRAAMFLKGKIKGEYLLTLAYDSDKDLKERVFRDINPDEFYPIYGDASTRGFDAQTTGRFYVRIDKGRSFLLYGDFNTSSQTPNRALSQFARTLTGAKWHLEDSKYAVNAFASRDTFRQVVLEFNANGTSGPFDLALPSGAVINSEKVEVLTRDRYQPAVILASAQKTRFSDYEIEPYAGRLLFKSPVASLDSNLNPQTIRITYEMDQGGTPFWVGGVDGQYKLTDNLEVGGVYVKDQNPSGEFSMGGANATYKFSEKTVAMAEVARTDRQAPAVSAGASLTSGATSTVIGSGNAARVEMRHSNGNLDARGYWGRSDATFDNPSSSLNRGREEAGGRVTYRLTPSTSVTAEALHTGDVVSGAKRDALSLRADQSFSNGIKLEVGVRRVQEETPSAVDPATGAASAGATVLSTGYTSARAKVTLPVPGLPQASVFGEYEKSFQGDDRRIASAGAEYKFSDFGRVYARLENNTGMASAGGIATTQKNNVALVGVDTSLTRDTKVFSEYRGRDTVDGAQSEAAVGLRNNWQLAEGLRASTSFERVQPFTRLATTTTSAEATAVTGAVEYTANPLWKGSARLEVRRGDASDGLLSTFGLAYKLSREWSLLTRSTWSHTAVKGATPGDQDRLRFQIGAAYRDVDTNEWNMVTRYEHRMEKDTTITPILKRAVDLASLHFNYQPERSIILTGRFATKYVNEESSGILSKSTGTLVSGRATYDISSRWDVGVTASLHTDGGLSNRKIGLGLEVGYLLQENLWLSAGYNFFGFKDKDLAGADYTDRGVYVRMRYKFDESLFDSKRDARLRGLTEEKAP